MIIWLVFVRSLRFGRGAFFFSRPYMIIMVGKQKLAVKNLGGGEGGTPRVFSPSYHVLYRVQDLDWLAEPGQLFF